MEGAFKGHLYCPKSSKINDAYFHADTSRAATETFQTGSKVRNLRRDPRATLCVFVEAFRGPWVEIEGTAEIVTLPDAMEPLVDYYRRLAGEHPDWDEYRR